MRILFVFGFVAANLFATVAPNFQGETMDGKRLVLKDQLKPHRALLVSFWATWCAPCLEEIHHVREELEKNPALPLDVLTVNVDTSETQTDVKPTAKLHKIAFPIILDPKHEILSKYQQTGTVPYSVLIGPDGKIESTFNGYSESMFDKIRSVLAALAPKEANGSKQKK